MKKNIKSQINWEKVGVYIAAITLILLFASKVMDISERLSRLEGKVEILVENL